MWSALNFFLSHLFLATEYNCPQHRSRPVKMKSIQFQVLTDWHKYEMTCVVTEWHVRDPNR